MIALDLDQKGKKDYRHLKSWLELRKNPNLMKTPFVIPMTCRPATDSANGLHLKSHFLAADFRNN